MEAKKVTGRKIQLLKALFQTIPIEETCGCRRSSVTNDYQNNRLCIKIIEVEGKTYH